jgi:cytidylate kinase
MPAITISRTLGSLGSQIAHDLADRLGYRLMGREIINKAACRAGAPEVALAVIDELELFGLRPSAKAHRAYLQAVQTLLVELAEEGQVVILGRAGQIILQDDPDVLHIRIVAPESQRVSRLVARQNIPPSAARAQIKKSDATRATYLRRNYRVDWNDPEFYDLVINTWRISVSHAVTILERAWHQRVGTPKT